MPTFHDRRAGLTALITIAMLCAAPAAGAQPVTLDEAQRLAVARDAGRQAIEEQSGAMREQAVAAGQWPDPEARIGAAQVPVDSFALDEEPMTMLEVGLMQRFPRGRSRSLARTGFEQRALGTDAEALDRERRVRLEVARAWHELDYLDGAIGIVARERRWANTLVAGALAAYTAGEGAQTELLDARLMALEVEERGIELERSRDVAATELARWVGSPAPLDRAPAPVDRPRTGALATLLARLEAHPRLAAMDHAVAAAETGSELAQQSYRPSFGVDLSYGLRQGRDAMGAPRSDMLSAMLVFDLPLFTRDRQDREVAAARAEARAAASQRADQLRDLEGRLRAAHARAVRLEETLRLYDQQIERLAGVSVEAALSAYRASDGSLADLIGTERRLFTVRDRLLRTHADLALAQADIDYLAGEQP